MTFDRSIVTRIAPDEVPSRRSRRETPRARSRRSPIAAAAGGLSENTSYDPIIASASGRHGVDARIVKAVIQVESSFRPRARSRKGAMGLMQLMPKTARQYEARNPYDPESNIQAGTQYLSTAAQGIRASARSRRVQRR